MTKPLKVIKTDGGICSQIIFAALGKYYEDKGFEVKYDLKFFREYGKDINGVFCRNYDIKKTFPDLTFNEASEKEIKQAKKNKNYIEEYLEERFYCFVKYQEYFRNHFNPEINNKEILNEIKASNSCAIHVRRGDLANSTGGEYGYTTSVDYFLRSINLIRKICPDVKFFFFSDEPEYIENEIIPKTDGISYKICKENGSDKGYIDLYLMSKCKYIISSAGSLGVFAKILSDKPETLLIMHKDRRYISEKFNNVIIVNDLNSIPDEAKMVSNIFKTKKKNNSLLKKIFSVHNEYKGYSAEKVKVITILGLKLEIKSKKKEKEVFDDIISLGYKCETAYSFEAVFNKKDSNLFNWVHITNIKNLIRFLNDPDLLLSKGLEWNEKRLMYRDIELDFYYHTKIDKTMLSGENKEKIIEEDTKEVISRMTYLKNKFLSKVNSDSRNLFVTAFDTKNDPKEVNEILWNLSEAISKISKNKNSKLLVVFKKNYAKDLEIKKLNNVIFEKINAFSPEHYAHGIDLSGWLKIYNKFNFNFNITQDYKTNIKNYIINRKIEQQIFLKLLFIKIAYKIKPNLYKNVYTLIPKGRLTHD